MTDSKEWVDAAEWPELKVIDQWWDDISYENEGTYWLNAINEVVNRANGYRLYPEHYILTEQNVAILHERITSAKFKDDIPLKLKTLRWICEYTETEYPYDDAEYIDESS